MKNGIFEDAKMIFYEWHIAHNLRKIVLLTS